LKQAKNVIHERIMGGWVIGNATIKIIISEFLRRRMKDSLTFCCHKLSISHGLVKENIKQSSNESVIELIVA
jgi:hypothetical protein